jgi:starch synthase
MHVLMVSAAVGPYSSGLLAEYCGGLATALSACGTSVTIVTPFHHGTKAHNVARRLRKLQVQLGPQAVECELLEAELPRSAGTVWFVDHPCFQREDSQAAHGDDAWRYALLAHAALAMMEQNAIAPDVIHGFDWQAGLVPLLSKRVCPRIPQVFTVAHPDALGCFDASSLQHNGVGYDHYNPDGIEFHGQASLLKAGLVFADRLVSISPSYARDLCETDLGAGLQGLYRHRQAALDGVLPGLEQDRWNPARETPRQHAYTAEHLDGKARAKGALQRAVGLKRRPNTALAVMVGSLDSHSGIDLLLDSADRWLPLRLQVLFAGPSDSDRAQRIEQLVARAPNRVAYMADLPDHKLRQALAGADISVVACSQDRLHSLDVLKALRYGAIPVACAVGGVGDVVIDFDPRSRSGTGFSVRPNDSEALVRGLERAVNSYAVKARWAYLVSNAMSQVHDWRDAAARHQQLYAGIAE